MRRTGPTRSSFQFAMGATLAAVAVVALSQAALAQTSPAAERAFRGRNGLMWLQGAAFGPLDQAARADQAPNEATRQAARYLADTGDLLTLAFAANPGPVPASRAKPEVWSDAAGFARSIAEFKAETQKLVEVAAGSDAAAFKAQIAVVGRQCGGCHEGFRTAAR